MARKQTPSYVLTLKLNTNNRDEAILDKRFEIDKEYYNVANNRLNKN